MLETCLNNKIIRDFLNNYKQSQWKKLIPSLIEIAILNLNSSFHTDIFSEEDIKNIIDDLKINQNKDVNIQQKKPKRESHSYVIFSKPSNQWRTADGGVPPISGNKEKEFFFDNSSLTNNSKYSKDNKEIARENIINKKLIKNIKSKIKEQVDNDKRSYYNKRNGDNNEYFKNNKNKQIEKINYAISYDKNLEPEIIEKTTINKNRKGKIVEKMTQEEYEQKFPDEEQNIENEYEEEDDDNNNEQNYEENEEEEYYDETKDKQNYYIQNNNQSKDRKNLYHYKTDVNNKNNSIILNNMNQGIKNNEENPEMLQNPQQSFNPKNFQKNIQQSAGLNQEKNNYINIVNNSSEPQYIKYDYNPNPSEQYNNNYKIGMSESDDKSSKYIGIEQKYQKKIDELEKNIINNGGNNIDNYANKLKVNITNMEDYSKNNNNEEYQNNNEEEENENEENNLSDMDLNEFDGGVLSQMSNMSEKAKSLFKRAMEEYPPLEEDTIYEQSQNK